MDVVFMRVAVISDIHGNLEAFREVLADIERIRFVGWQDMTCFNYVRAVCSLADRQAG